MTEKTYPLSASAWDWEVIDELQNTDHEEDAYLEYKRELTYDSGSDVSKSEWKKGIEREFTAFANAHGGIILFGMSDNRNPTGFKKPVEEVSQIAYQYVQHTTPIVDIDSSGFIQHPHRDERGFLAVEVKEANAKPVATRDSAYYLRTPHGKSPMPREHIQSLFVERDRRQQAVLQLLVEMDQVESTFESHIDVSNTGGPPPFGTIDTDALRDALRNCTHLYTQSGVQRQIKYVLKILRDIELLERNYGRHRSPNAADPDRSKSWSNEQVWNRLKNNLNSTLRHLENVRKKAGLQQRYEEEF